MMFFQRLPIKLDLLFPCFLCAAGISRQREAGVVKQQSQAFPGRLVRLDHQCWHVWIINATQTMLLCMYDWGIRRLAVFILDVSLDIHQLLKRQLFGSPLDSPAGSYRSVERWPSKSCV